jgi:hypothetical protein
MLRSDFDRKIGDHALNGVPVRSLKRRSLARRKRAEPVFGERLRALP